jgi:hypothetical protein
VTLKKLPLNSSNCSIQAYIYATNLILRGFWIRVGAGGGVKQEEINNNTFLPQKYGRDYLSGGLN